MRNFKKIMGFGIVFSLCFYILNTKASKVEEAQTPPLLLSPTIKQVLTDDTKIDDAGNFFRVILLNTEDDPCLTLEELNLRDNNPRIMKRVRLCSGEEKEKKISFTDIQEISFYKLNFENGILKFTVQYVPVGTGASLFTTECAVDPRSQDMKVSCKEVL